MLRLVLVFGLLLPMQAAASLLGGNLQLYSVCDDASCGEASFDAGFFDRIWAQAGIRFDILEPHTIGIPGLAASASGELDPLAALAAFRNAVPPQDRTGNTVHLAFTGALHGVYGEGYRNTPQTQTFPFAIVEAGLHPRIGAVVAAHEIGHVLGAGHVANAARDNLMLAGVPTRVFFESAFVPTILDETRAAVRASPLLAPVPAPAPLVLTGSALALLAAFGGVRRGDRTSASGG